MRFLVIITMLSVLPVSLFSSVKQAGFIVAMEGDVKVFRNVGKPDIPSGSIKVSWDGKKYNSFGAKLYGKVYEGDIIVTNNDSKAKVVMGGANTVMVGPYTHFAVTTSRDIEKADGQSSFKLLYGKIRSVVKSKVGKGGKYEVKTPSSVIGVRGTDFYTVYKPQSGVTTVSTLEGVVAVKNLTGKIKKEVLVESGYSTSVINLDAVDLAEFKKVTKVKSLSQAALPTAPQKVRSVELKSMKDTSTFETQLKELDIDIQNKDAAQASEQQSLKMIDTGTTGVDVSKDPLNMNLDVLIKKVVKEEQMRQREEGALNSLDKWIRNY